MGEKPQLGYSVQFYFVTQVAHSRLQSPWLLLQRDLLKGEWVVVSHAGSASERAWGVALRPTAVTPTTATGTDPWLHGSQKQRPSATLKPLPHTRARECPSRLAVCSDACGSGTGWAEPGLKLLACASGRGHS